VGACLPPTTGSHTCSTGLVERLFDAGADAGADADAGGVL
jgi:hypothetical protein